MNNFQGHPLQISPIKWIVILLLGVAVLAQNTDQQKIKILILGDSLTEGYGVDKEEAFPALLEKKLNAKTNRFQVINGGSSGSTSASGLKRLKWYEKTKPNIVILTLGSNDGLRGVKVVDTKKNLDAIIRYCLERKWQVMVVGLKVPPNYGPEYSQGFENIFRDLSNQYKLPYLKFLLEGVAGEAKLNQEDGIHPNKEGHLQVALHLLQFLNPILEVK